MCRMHILETITMLIKYQKSNKWRSRLYSWIGRLNLVKISILPKFIYRFNGIPIKMSSRFFVGIDTIILESQRNQEENRKSRNIPKHICPTYFWQNCNSNSMEER